MHISGDEITREKCEASHAHREYLSTADSAPSRVPPLLYTFPGSGNTWVRMLIEYASGVHTGSVYRDGKIQMVMPGEEYCSHAVSAVKAHPVHFSGLVVTGVNTSEQVEMETRLRDGVKLRPLPSKCTAASPPVTRFKRAVLLVRNPFACMYSESVRQLTHLHAGAPSVGEFLKNSMHSRFLLKMNALAKQYGAMWAHYGHVTRVLGTENVMFIKYETLLKEASREDALRRIMAFLDVPNHPVREPLGCAFRMGDKPDMNRNNKKNIQASEVAAAGSSNRVRPRSEAERASRLTRAFAYNYSAEKICHWWAYFAYPSKRIGYSLHDASMGQGAVRECPTVVSVGDAGLKAFEESLQRGREGVSLFTDPSVAPMLEALRLE